MKLVDERYQKRPVAALISGAQSASLRMQATPGGFGKEYAGTPEKKVKHALKPIENIQVGDWVWAWDESTGRLVQRQVKRLFRHRDRPIFEVMLRSPNGSEERVRGTEEHPFWVVGRGWVPLNQLASGDEVQLREGGVMTVMRVTDTHKKADVYNFEVDEVHSYFVGAAGILVHNMSSISGNNRIAAENLRKLGEGTTAEIFAFVDDPDSIALVDSRYPARDYLEMRENLFADASERGFSVPRVDGIVSVEGAKFTEALRMERIYGVSSKDPHFVKSFTPETPNNIRSLIQQFKEQGITTDQLEVMVVTEARNGRKKGDVVLIDPSPMEAGPFMHESALLDHLNKYESTRPAATAVPDGSLNVQRRIRSKSSTGAWMSSVSTTGLRYSLPPVTRIGQVDWSSLKVNWTQPWKYLEYGIAALRTTKFDFALQIAHEFEGGKVGFRVNDAISVSARYLASRDPAGREVEFNSKKIKHFEDFVGLLAHEGIHHLQGYSQIEKPQYSIEHEIDAFMGQALVMQKPRPVTALSLKEWLYSAAGYAEVQRFSPNPWTPIVPLEIFGRRFGREGFDDPAIRYLGSGAEEIDVSGLVDPR